MASRKQMDERAEKVSFRGRHVVIHLSDDREIAVPLDWFPKLLEATSEQRENWVLIGGGYGVHWPDIDEDLSTPGILRGSISSFG